MADGAVMTPAVGSCGVAAETGGAAEATSDGTVAAGGTVGAPRGVAREISDVAAEAGVTAAPCINAAEAGSDVSAIEARVERSGKTLDGVKAGADVDNEAPARAGVEV